MSEWITKREAFFKAAIQSGLAGPEQLDTLFPLGYNVPEARVFKWLRSLTCVPSKILTGRQLINRFRLGADPEFVFLAGGRANASALGLKQGQAFGADNNGRLAEIRPYPSRSALEVVASILTTMRWMAVLRPKTVAYGWYSGAYMLDDGLGGHVHFGRKRPKRDLEITALDAVEELLLSLGAYPVDEVGLRRRGDAHRQIYGALHDFRLQTHGYEYRTFPSWLDSPALAFLTITLSKLAVHNPELCRGMQVSMNRATNFQKIKNLLAYYRNVDNDARLLLMMLGRGFPVHIGGDFRGRWGIPTVSPVTMPKVTPKVAIVPPTIKPDAGTIKELFELFSIGVPLPWPTAMTPTWEPATLPTGYKLCLDAVTTDQAKGFGEMIWDLCYSTQWPITLHPALRGDVPGEARLTVAKNIAQVLPAGWQHGLKGVQVHKNANSSILISQTAREGALARSTKDTLTSGVFPLWRAKDVQEDSYAQWVQHTKKVAPRDRTFASKVLFQSVREIPGVPGR